MDDAFPDFIMSLFFLLYATAEEETVVVVEILVGVGGNVVVAADNHLHAGSSNPFSANCSPVRCVGIHQEGFFTHRLSMQNRVRVQQRLVQSVAVTRESDGLLRL